MMQQHEAEGTLDHPEYQAAITILNYRHVCRLKEWPAPLQRSLEGWNMDIYRAMQTGARGYLLKSAPREELLRAVRSVAAGQRFRALERRPEQIETVKRLDRLCPRRLGKPLEQRHGCVETLHLHRHLQSRRVSSGDTRQHHRADDGRGGDRHRRRRLPR